MLEVPAKHQEEKRPAKNCNRGGKFICANLKKVSIRVKCRSLYMDNRQYSAENYAKT